MSQKHNLPNNLPVKYHTMVLEALSDAYVEGHADGVQTGMENAACEDDNHHRNNMLGDLIEMPIRDIVVEAFTYNMPATCRLSSDEAHKLKQLFRVIEGLET